MSDSPRPAPTGGASEGTPSTEDTYARTQGLEDLPLDLQVRTLAALEADLRASLDALRD